MAKEMSAEVKAMLAARRKAGVRARDLAAVDAMMSCDRLTEEWKRTRKVYDSHGKLVEEWPLPVPGSLEAPLLRANWANWPGSAVLYPRRLPEAFVEALKARLWWRPARVWSYDRRFGSDWKVAPCFEGAALDLVMRAVLPGREKYSA
jgi:hypothetical protein